MTGRPVPIAERKPLRPRARSPPCRDGDKQTAGTGRILPLMPRPPADYPSHGGVRLGIIVGALTLLTAAAFSQQGEYQYEPEITNLPYDGQFAFTRVTYTTRPGGYYYQG